MKIKGAIFDLDGTLIDSMPIWQNLSFDFLTSLGVTPKPDLREKVSAMFLRESSEYTIKEYNLNCSVEDVLKYMYEQINDFYFNRVPPKADAFEFLKKLKANGVKMCVATATERSLASAALKLNGMLDFFDEIFTCSDIGLNKQDPKIFELTLEALGTKKEETFVFEDAAHAVKTANKAGFPVIAIFDEAAAKEKDEISKFSQKYIHNYCELDGFFENIE